MENLVNLVQTNHDVSSNFVDPSFWKNKTVLLTGHTGFKGSWLSIWLDYLGAKVIGYALPPVTQPNLFSLANIDTLLMQHHEADIRDLNYLKTVMQQSKLDIVIHMAAQSLVLDAYDDPVNTFDTNVMGTVNLLEAVRASNTVKAVLNVTTDKCYENKEWPWPYRENEQLGGHDPYSNSKACSELVTNAYRDSFLKEQQIGIASARAGNVIGGGDWTSNRLLPDFFRAAMNKTALAIRCPNAIRPWQHVLEPLSGYLLLIQKLYENPDQYASAWNFGPNSNDTQSVISVLNQLNVLWSDPVKINITEAKRHEANYLKLDIEKAKTYLNWQPRCSLKNALEKCVEWYRGYVDGQGALGLCIDQIRKFIN